MRRFLVIFALFLSSDIFAQSAPPESGAAADASRSESTPVSLFTGIPSISFPLISYAHQSKIGVNISLDYFAGGIKTEQSTTPEGIGWSLSTGGIITRTVRGIPDDCPNTGFMYAPPVPADPGDISYRDYNKGFDAEMDVFQVNFPGYSGKFYIGKDSQIVMTPLSKISISVVKDTSQNSRIDSLSGTLDEFVIRTENGTKFFFREKETQDMTVRVDSSGEALYRNLKYSSTWYLSKILSYNISDSIHFDYVSVTSPTVYVDSQSVRITTSATTHSDSLVVADFTPIQSKVISQIILPDYRKIKFTYSNSEEQNINGNNPVLRRIEFFEPGDYFKYGYILNWDTMHSAGEYNRPYLQGFDWYNSSYRKKGFKFTYNGPLNPTPYLNSKDHWGFYNGQDNHREQVPSVPGVYTGANREADTLAKAGTLSSVIDAKGGTTFYDFENNDRYPYKDSVNTLMLDFSSATSSNILLNRITGKKTFFKIISDRTYPLGYPTAASGPGELVVSITNLSSTTTYYTKTIDLNQLFYTGISGFYCELTSGNYLLKTVLGSGTSLSESFSNKFSWYTQSDSTGNAIRSGGLRIKRIRHYDSFTGKSDTLATYKYVTESGKSSGFLGVKPAYAYSFINTTTKYITSLPTNNNDYSDGSSVGYSRVEEIKGSESRNLGKVVTVFSDLDDDVYDNSPVEYPYAPQLTRSYRQGLEKRKIIFDNTGRIVSTSASVFNFVEKNYDDANYCSFRTIIGFRPNNSNYFEPQYYSGTRYYPLCGRPQLIATADTLFHPDSSITVRTQTMQYDSNYNIKKVISPYDLDKNLSLEKRFYYPYNYVIGGGIGKLRDSGIFVPVSNETWITGDGYPRLLSASATDYDVQFGSSKHLIRPYKMYALQTNKPILQSSIGGFDSSKLVRDTSRIILQARNFYEDNNDLVKESVNEITGISESVIYAGIFPIAKISNGPRPKLLVKDTNPESIDVVTTNAFTSFEQGADQSWNSGSSTINYGGLFGQFCANLTGATISKTNLDSSLNYIVSFWANGTINASGSVNGTFAAPDTTPATLIETRGSWSLYMKTIRHPENVDVTGTGYIDELRLYPSNAQMVTTSYDYFRKPIVAVDANNTAQYFEYDALDKLQLIRGNDQNIVKKFENSDSLFPISFTPVWLALSSDYWICDPAGNGYVYRKEIDTARYSDTYLNFRYVYDHFDTTRCPLAPCDSDPAIKRIGYNCERACVVTTEAIYIRRTNEWTCTFHYKWSDNSVSDDISTVGPDPCSVGIVCP